MDDAGTGRNDGGFSLVELLVITVIIGILAAIAMTSFFHLRERGWQAQLVADVRNAVLDIEAEAVGDDGRFPAAWPAFATSDDAITLTYDVSADRTTFCVEGTDDRPAGGVHVAHYSNGSGVEFGAACSL